jgi:hypothetical protein
MSQKYDDFFKGSASNELTNKILKSAQVELEHNRQRKKSKVWFLIVGPILTAVAASFFIFKINIMQNNNSSPQALSGLAVIEDVNEEILNTAEHLELISDLGDDQEAVEIVDELGFLQDFEEIELISEEELEG